MMSPKERAMHAKLLMDNPLYQEAMIHIKGDLFNQWSKNTIWSGKRKREKLWDMMQGVIEFESKITQAFNDGIMLAKQEERAEKLKNMR